MLCHLISKVKYMLNTVYLDGSIALFPPNLVKDTANLKN